MLKELDSNYSDEENEINVDMKALKIDIETSYQ